MANIGRHQAGAPPRVVVTDFDYPDLSIERAILEPAGMRLEAFHLRDPEGVLQVARDADALMVQYAPITARVLDGLQRCRVIARYGVGLDTIDVEAAQRRGIPVHNVPDYCTEEVADHTLALMLAIERGVCTLAQAVRAGVWSLSPVRPLRRIRGRVLGMIGCGRIGRAVALRAQAFGMRVIAYDPFLIDPDTVRALGVELLPLDEVLASSDVLTLHRPGNLDGTPGLGAAELARLKPGAVLINTARGSLLDEGALHAQLDARRIRAAGLDVLAQEPAALHHPLVQHDGTLITPHAAWYSEESEQELRRRVAEIVLAGVQGAPSRTT